MNRKDFYSADPRRGSSKHTCYGISWKGGSESPTFGIYWIHATGEIYAANNSTGDVEVLGVIAPNEPHHVERVLEGWADECGQIESMEWIRERAANPCPYGDCDGSQIIVQGQWDDVEENYCLCNPKHKSNQELDGLDREEAAL